MVSTAYACNGPEIGSHGWYRGTSLMRNSPPPVARATIVPIPPGYQPACTAVMSAAWSAYISTMAFAH